LSKFGDGVIAWAVPYITAIPLMGLMVNDVAAFRTIMIVEGAFVGAFLACYYFRTVQMRFLKEGITLGSCGL
jgi:hypothetical protein